VKEEREWRKSDREWREVEGEWREVEGEWKKEKSRLIPRPKCAPAEKDLLMYHCYHCCHCNASFHTCTHPPSWKM